MVLTHRDFGRAYLTESDGWARRFLIGLFANYTVLFVGYSHNDTIMTYLTPSLPPDGGQQRFALIGDRSDDSDHWHRMGVEPVTFHQTDVDDFSGLHTGCCRIGRFSSAAASLTGNNGLHQSPADTRPLTTKAPAPSNTPSRNRS